METKKKKSFGAEEMIVIEQFIEKTSLEDLVYIKLKLFFEKLKTINIDSVYETVLKQLEKPLITLILERTRFNQKTTAKVLGLNRNTLRNKIKSLGIVLKRK